MALPRHMPFEPAKWRFPLPRPRQRVSIECHRFCVGYMAAETTPNGVQEQPMAADLIFGLFV